jgi:putative Mg2+ transporter-C (MgtC) family protein
METWAENRTFLRHFLDKFLFAVWCGGLIDMERGRRGEPAGLRTNIPSCLSATMDTPASEFIYANVTHSLGDPARIAAHVVTGIGFNGSGTVIPSQGTITAITSAAVIWTVPAIGLCTKTSLSMTTFTFSRFHLSTFILPSRCEEKLLRACNFVQLSPMFRKNGGRAWGCLSGMTEFKTSKYPLAQRS